MMAKMRSLDDGQTEPVDVPWKHNGYALFDALTSGLPIRFHGGHSHDTLLQGFGEWLATLKPIHQVISQVLLATLRTNPFTFETDPPTDHCEVEPDVYLKDTIKDLLRFVDELLDNHCDIDSAMYAAAEKLKDELDQMANALMTGDAARAVNSAMIVGYRLCQLEVLPNEDNAKAGLMTRIGSSKGKAAKAHNAEQRREATRQAVRERWQKNPKLSLSAIQQKLAETDGKPFGSLRTIEKNTAGMKRTD